MLLVLCPYTSSSHSCWCWYYSCSSVLTSAYSKYCLTCCLQFAARLAALIAQYESPHSFVAPIDQTWFWSLIACEGAPLAPLPSLHLPLYVSNAIYRQCPAALLSYVVPSPCSQFTIVPPAVQFICCQYRSRAALFFQFMLLMVRSTVGVWGWLGEHNS